MHALVKSSLTFGLMFYSLSGFASQAESGKGAAKKEEVTYEAIGEDKSLEDMVKKGCKSLCFSFDGKDFCYKKKVETVREKHKTWYGKAKHEKVKESESTVFKCPVGPCEYTIEYDLRFSHWFTRSAIKHLVNSHGWEIKPIQIHADHPNCNRFSSFVYYCTLPSPEAPKPAESAGAKEDLKPSGSEAQSSSELAG